MNVVFFDLLMYIFYRFMGVVFMVALKAYYDGKGFIPLSDLKFKPKQTAIIVIEDETSEPKKTSCKGIANSYAKKELIQLEDETISSAFSGE
jgi:predicted membrane protein